MNSILYVSPFAFDVSGADESLLTILRQLDRKRFRPYVALPPRSPYRSRFEEAGATTFALPIARLKRTANPLYWLLFAIWLPIEVTLFVGLIWTRKISLVHLNMESSFSAALAGRICRIPVVIHYRGNASARPKWFFDFYLPFLTHLADHLFVISRAVAEGFRQRRLERNIEVLYNALDLTPFLAEGPRDYFARRLPAFRDKEIITYLGRLHPRKRISDLIEAAGVLSVRRPRIAFAIVGGDMGKRVEAKYKEELERRMAQLETSPTIHFFERERDVPAVLRSSDLFVLPSIDEGFGRVIIEAMAAGVPIVATDSGALPELLDGGRYGALVPIENPAKLAEAIERALTDPDTKGKAAEARQFARKTFDIVQHVARIEAMYDRLFHG